MTTTQRTPKIERRPADGRGATRLGWLDSKHSFSFGGYHDPRKVAYHGLRVLNDDRIAPGMGFDTHPHRDMEILTWVLDGELAHRDSTPGSGTGHAGTIGAGGMQLMSAGTGVTHSEHNARADAPVHLLQVWIEPTQRGTEPRYQEATPDRAGRAGALAPLANPDGADGALQIGADARVYVADLAPGQRAELPLPADRVAYVHVATGSAVVNDQPAAAGDAVTIEGGGTVWAAAAPDASDAQEIAQVLVFVLPA